jgi:RNA polymerase sigma-70 factor (ECF subfamily)
MDGLNEAPAGAWRLGSVTETEASFERLVVDHLDRAYRLAAVILGSTDDAEEAVSDAALLAWRSRKGLRDPDRFEAWFSRIVVNTCRDRLRSRRRRPVVEVFPTAPNEASEPGDFRELIHTRDELARAFELLSADDRITLVLRFWADLSIESIAERLGIPSGTVKSRLHHALARLRAGLRDPEVDQ